MKLIVGLGNPGGKYKNTRHNLGFRVVETLLRKLTPLEKTNWKKNRRLKAEIAKITGLISSGGEKQTILILAKPLTMMNNSGLAVKKLVKNWKLKIENLYIVHDDLDLPLGKIKIVKNRGAAGHHGVESVIEFLKTSNFIRFRLGIGPAKGEVDNFVLGEFKGREGVEADKMVKKAAAAIQFALKNGIQLTQLK